MDEWITIREACECCNVSEKALRDAIARGDFEVRMLMEQNPRKGSHRPVKHVSALALERWMASGGGVRGTRTGARTA